MNGEDDHRDAEDILSESLEFLGGTPVIDDNVVTYGPLSLQIASKEGKANTLLADHLFSPALYLAERIERGLLPVHGKTVIELGSGTGLPSLLMSTRPDHPSLAVVTDYPDDNILGNLTRNVDNNRPHFHSKCRVECAGYEWGTDSEEILKLLPSPTGYDVMILSDLLHFHDCHDVLITSIKGLLVRSKDARVHISAGKYTQRHYCDSFVHKGQIAGLEFDEVLVGLEEAPWKGEMKVGGLDRDALSIRKANCYYWIGRWTENHI